MDNLVQILPIINTYDSQIKNNQLVYVLEDATVMVKHSKHSETFVQSNYFDLIKITQRDPYEIVYVYKQCYGYYTIRWMPRVEPSWNPMTYFR